MKRIVAMILSGMMMLVLSLIHILEFWTIVLGILMILAGIFRL